MNLACYAPLLVLLLTACTRTASQPQQSAALVERSRVSMGSEVHLSAWTADAPRAVRAFEKAFDEFDRLDRLLSIWKEGSDVLRVNAEAGRTPVKVSPETLEVMKVAREVSDWTGGKFDVTFGALSGLWKFDHDQDDQIPRSEDIRRRLPLIDYQSVDVNTRDATVFLRRPGMRLHFGGIGKGYAVDRAAAILRASGVTNFLIQAGGDLYGGGTRGDRPWRSGIRDPRGPADQVFAAMDLRDETFSTSGDYERYFLRDGRRYHHILDPDSGQPARGCRSVTIVTRQAVLADALSTGVFVLGPQAGMALIESLPDVEGVIVSDTNDVLISTGLKGRLELRRAPTDAP